MGSTRPTSSGPRPSPDGQRSLGCTHSRGPGASNGPTTPGHPTRQRPLGSPGPTSRGPSVLGTRPIRRHQRRPLRHLRQRRRPIVQRRGPPLLRRGRSSPSPTHAARTRRGQQRPLGRHGLRIRRPVRRLRPGTPTPRRRRRLVRRRHRRRRRSRPTRIRGGCSGIARRNHHDGSRLQILGAASQIQKEGGTASRWRMVRCQNLYSYVGSHVL
mmetsp:Transcript_3846/g.8270  ORF Transcript_3846/g.8270 Transcript_3846/m.8270 type:complete len:213 (-) Transcript_3846:1194-1832(-)